MAKRRVVCGRRLTVHRCADDERLLILRVRTKRLDVRYPLRASAADALMQEIGTWCDEIGAQLVGTEAEDDE